MRVLLAEDDRDLAGQLAGLLQEAGYAIDIAPDGEEAQFLGETEPYDAVILDLGLPVVDGLTVLKRWRDQSIRTPVLILTARDSWSEKVDGLDAGADDYVTKPFELEEVLARLRALIRRASGHASAELACGPVQLDTRSGRVSVSGASVRLTAQEYKLLSYLMHHKGKVVSRTELIEHIYDQDFDRDSNTIEVFVTRIRTIDDTLVSVPNTSLLTGKITNYTALIRERQTPLIVKTTITLGYDVPWKLVHDTMIAAALATSHILQEPAPRVWQTSLDDFYVSYQVRAATLHPEHLGEIYSELHQNLQDYCNEAGIEILSPHYGAMRDGNQTTIPANYLPADYTPPTWNLATPWQPAPARESSGQ